MIRSLRTPILLVALIALMLLACGKRRDAAQGSPNASEPMPDDHAEILLLEAKLYADDLTANPEQCPDACVIASRICELSGRICDLSTTSPKCSDATLRCNKAKLFITARCTCTNEVR